MAPFSYTSLQKLKLLEVSALGIHQLAAGVPVTEQRDRDLVAKLLAVPRLAWETLLGAGRPEDRKRIARMVESALKSRKAA
jgi:hypothetical protein